MESLVAYTYSPLEFSDSIRLLLLQPANNKNEHLRGSLVTQTLSSIQNDLHIYYNALSYVWGDSTRREALQLMDENNLCRFWLRLTTNLHSALTDIRDKSRAIFIWADAICINQDNLEERGHQVGLMGSIYREAGCTVIYLGLSSPDIDYAFDAIQRHSGISTKRHASPQGNTAQEADLEVGVLNDAIETLCSHDWFKRGWVFQEFVLSQNPRIQCGKNRVGWNHLRTMIQHLQCSGTSVSRFLDMDKTRNDDAARTFSQLVISRKGAQLSDPRDFFFCLMGIASDAEAVQKCLPIDYSLDVRDVYTRAAEYMIQHMGPLSVLEHVNSETGDYGLPSYVPTWGVAELRKLSVPKDLLPPGGPLWGERNVVRDCRAMRISQRQVASLKPFGDTIPRYGEFVDALRESLERLGNHTQPDVMSPLRDLWDYWTVSPKTPVRQKLWAQFCGAILGHKPMDIVPDYNEEDWPRSFFTGSGEGPLQDIQHMIKLIEQNLSVTEDQDDSMPESRLALCHRHIALVPAGTVDGDISVDLESSRDQNPSHSCLVFRSAQQNLLAGEEFKLLDHFQVSIIPMAVCHPIVELRGIAQVVAYNSKVFKYSKYARSKKGHIVLI